MSLVFMKRGDTVFYEGFLILIFLLLFKRIYLGSIGTKFYLILSGTVGVIKNILNSEEMKN